MHGYMVEAEVEAQVYYPKHVYMYGTAHYNFTLAITRLNIVLHVSYKSRE